MSEFINNCKYCGKPFPADAKWKTTCYQCWIKREKPNEYAKRFEMADIECKRCGEMFIDEAWKDICFRCWLAEKHEGEMNDLEEREQFDD